MTFDTLIRQMTQAASRGDGNAVASCFTDDGVYHDVFYGSFRGQEIADLIENYFHRDGENFVWDIHQPVRQGDIGYARYVFSYDSRLPQARGRRGIFEGVAICHLQEDLITRYREVATAASGLYLLGFSAKSIHRFVKHDTENLLDRPETVGHIDRKSAGPS